jgi:hypothetical protein
VRDNKVIGTVAGVTALGSGLAIVFCLTGGFAQRLDPTPHAAVGRVLAEQTLSLLKPGGQVTVISRDTSAFQNPATDIQFASYSRALKRGGVKIAAIESLQVDPLRPMSVPSGDFFRLIKTSAKGNVIVSLMGPPMLTDAQLLQLGEPNPAIVAFCPGPLRDQVDLRSLFSRGLLQAAVVSKRGITASLTRPASERDAFDRQFVAVTSGNLTALPTSSNREP